MLKGKTVLLGVTGGIAAYKAAELCSLMVKQHADVRVVMTENATKFISPIVFENLSKNHVATDTFDRSRPFEVEHIALADAADVVIAAPATADFIAKAANGLADDMLTTTVLACDCPKIAAPAMNTKMYENPVTLDNIEKLKKYGWQVIEPASGRLACGAVGKGKLPDPSGILEYVIMAADPRNDMKGLNVLVTAGPTREAIDPVRYITNHSSGRMGYAVAKAAAKRGARVTLVSGPTELPVPVGISVVDVVSAQDMFDAVTARSADQDIIIKAAAVADYRPAEVAGDKIKKSGDDSDLCLRLERTNDILAYLGEHKKDGQMLCGFSMETKDMLANSRKKLVKKNLDLIAANNLKEAGAGFGVDTNLLTVISADEEISLPLMSKQEAADRLLDEIMKKRGGA